MKRAHTLRTSACLLVGICATATAHGAYLLIDDTTAGQLTLNWLDFQGGTIVNGVAMGADGSVVIGGDSATFSGTWNTTTSGSGSGGTAFIIDPSDLDLARASVEATWSNTQSTATIALTATTSPFGGWVSTLAPILIGKGVPMPDGVTPLQTKFINPSTGAGLAAPGLLSLHYAGDLVPELTDPIILSQPPNGLSPLFSDRHGPWADQEQCENLRFDVDTTIFSLRWWGAYAEQDTPETDLDDFQLLIYADEDGTPAVAPMLTIPLPDTVRAGNGSTSNRYRQSCYLATLPAPLVLQANTTYWMSLLNNTVADADDNWTWSRSDTGDWMRAFRHLGPTGAWTVDLVGPGYALELGGSFATPCTTDLDGDDTTGGVDLAILLAAWGACEVPECAMDLNGDGTTDGADLAALLAAWGPCNAPAALASPADRRSPLETP